jgi:hypothetical protein
VHAPSRRAALFVAVLAVAVVVFRGRAWFFPYGDASTGLYLHIAAALLDGHLPYTSAWDYRPPGLFALYAAALALFGPRLAWNVLTSLALGATALAVGLLARRLDARTPSSAAWCAAAFFVLLAPENDGLWGNTEVEISAFVAWSLWFAMCDRRGFAAPLASGLLAGCALQCKLSALLLTLLPAAIILLGNGNAALKFRRASLFVAGFAAPIAVEVAAYVQAGVLPLLLFATFDATSRRAHELNLDYYRANVRWLIGQLFILAPQIELALFARPAFPAAALASWGWLIAALASIVLEGEFFHYHFILLAAPVALLGALGFLRLLRRFAGSAARRRAIWIAVFALTFGLHDYYETVQGATFAVHRRLLHDAGWRTDPTSALIAALRRVAPGERSILLVGQSPFVYDLLGVAAPTRFTAPVIWLDPRLSAMAGSDAQGELARLFRLQPNVAVVSKLDDPTYDPGRVRLLKRWLGLNYRPVFAATDFTIFRAIRATRSASPRIVSRLERACARSERRARPG